MSSANAISGAFYELSSSVSTYFGLGKNNELLLEENARLRSLLESYATAVPFDTVAVDSSLNYRFIPVKIISNNYGNTRNILTLKGGSKLGIQAEMGVVTSNGIVGIVQKVSPTYSTVMSLLNTQSKINAKLANSNHFGYLDWDTQSPNIVQLKDLPRLAPVKVGDTILTGGNSTIFPAGIGIGTISSYELVQGGNYFEVQVQLFNDMTNLSHGYVINNTDALEIKNLEEATINEE